MLKRGPTEIAVRIWHVRGFNVSPDFSSDSRRVQREVGNSWFQQTTTKQAWDLLVKFVNLLCAISIVAAEEFIPAVSSQHYFNPSLPCEDLAVIGGYDRGVCKRLVIEFDDLRKDSKCIFWPEP